MVNKEPVEKDGADRKKRKLNVDSGASSTKQQSKENLYESIIQHEEDEAKSRSAKDDMMLFHKTCGNLKAIFDEIALLKKENNSEKAKSDILEKRIEGSLIFIILKKLNRMDKIRLRAGRDALHKEKQRVDSSRLQLQNLLYELNHLKREVERCYQFKSQDEEIELVTEEEFYKTAPDNISQQEKTQNDEHARRLARLEWELQQRKELSELLKKLSVSKENISKEISTKVERLNSLAPSLDKLLVASRPLQTALEMEIEKEWQVKEIVRLLPRPLYLAHLNLSAYAEACDNYLKVTVEGNEEDLRTLEEMQGNKNDDNEDDGRADENQESDLEENENNEQRKKYHKRKSTIESKEIKKKNLLQPHPFRVIASFEKKNKQEKLTITLHYFPKLNFITIRTCVEIENVSTAAGYVVSADTIMNNLYNGDIGESSPNPKTKFQLREFEMTELDLMQYLKEKEFGKPYQWVQKLCGIDFQDLNVQMPSTSSAKHDFSQEQNRLSFELAQDSVPQIVKVIRSRWISRLILFKQVQSLENKNLEAIQSSSNNSGLDEECSNLRISSSLVQWIGVTWQEYSSDPLTQRFVKNEIATENDIFYRAIVTRNSAKLECLVCVAASFPQLCPTWSLCLSWNGKHHAQSNQAIREMEMWTNSITMNSNNRNFILSAQLKRTMASLDIFLETEGPLYSPAEFIQDKTFIQPFKGRIRARPFKSVKIGNNIIFKQIDKLN